MGFLEQFFAERGNFEVKPNNEADVLCPFPHDKGYETRPSAHVNIKKDIFHCKTCASEGRFSKGGLSEIGFVSKYYNISYAQAVRFMSIFEGKITEYTWNQALENLKTNTQAVKYLIEKRGLTPETIKKYQIGYAGDGIAYPVFINGLLADIRTYNMKWKEESEANPGVYIPKIKSQRETTNLLFPYDHWKNDERPTLLCAGENDTLLARQNGFNALTVTFGEGSRFPKVFIKQLEGKTVYICYDCDEAGKQGSRQVAFELKEAGATVYLVDLGLSGTKDDKDISDFFLKHNLIAEDLYKKIEEAIPYSEDDFIEAKEAEYPLVPLWEIINPEYSNRYISSRVIMMGKYDRPMETPTAIKWACTSPKFGDGEKTTACDNCPFRKMHQKNEESYWFLEDNLKDLLYLVEVNEDVQEKNIKQKILNLPAKCPGVTRKIIDRAPVQKVILAPDVETEDELSGYKGVEQYAYTIGKESSLEDGQRYRAYFKRFPHPLQQQFIVAVINKVEESDNAINRFKVTPEVIVELSQFKGTPDEVMQKRYENAKNVIGNFAKEMIVWSVDLVYHSVLSFPYARGIVDRGCLDALIIGESRTGKSDTALKLQQFYRVGNFTELKTATTAGMLGGADKMPSGGYRIKWGVIPRNHRGMVVLDELSGMPKSVMKSLTGLRSQQKARIEKIVSGVAPARVRKLWISNPEVQLDGKSLPIRSYPHGVRIVLDLIGSDEDTARFDFVYIMPNDGKYISPFEDTQGMTEDEYVTYNEDSTPYRNLIYWAWSRRTDQIKWGGNVDRYLWQKSQELNEKYDTDVKFFGSEASKKLGRIAVSVAAMCFSCDESGESIVVEKEHVDWAVKFMKRCYDNNVFRIVEYVEQAKLTTTTNPEVNAIVAGLIKAHPVLIKSLVKSTKCSIRELEAVSGLDRPQLNTVINNMIRHSLITVESDRIQSTYRLTLAVEDYKNTETSQRHIPVSEQGGSFL